MYSLPYVLIGYPGAGKTNSFRIIKSYFDHTYYLKLNKTFRPKDFYIGLLKLLEIYDFDYGLPLKFLSEKVAEALNQIEGKSLVIIDEGNRLSAGSLTYLHQMIDDTKNTGYIISGTAEFELDFQKWLRLNTPGISELNSRIIEWKKLDRPLPHELKAVADKNGIKAKDELDRLAKTCKDYRQLFHEVIKLRILEAAANSNSAATISKDEKSEDLLVSAEL
jgi:DNA transposition AAA+ family ATPase